MLNAEKDNTALLVAEVERLNKYIKDHGTHVSQQLDVLEADMERLVAENARLITVREMAFVERDACVGLLARIALTHGMNVGTVAGNTVALDLPSGQVSWTFEESEAHLIETLPAYTGEIEKMEITEKYARVMNPGL